MLLNNYPVNKTIRMYRVGGQDLGDVFSKVPRAKTESASLLYGHVPCRIEQYIQRPCNYFTILREPIRRFLSFYRYVKYDFKAHQLHTQLRSGEISISDLLVPESPELNKMTKLLAGIDVRENPRDGMLLEAKKNLANMKAFGLMEQFDASCLILSKTFRWKEPYYKKTNVTSTEGRNEKISESILSEIADANALDMELYNYGRRLFEEKLEKESRGLQVALSSFKKIYSEKLTEKEIVKCKGNVLEYVKASVT